MRPVTCNLQPVKTKMYFSKQFHDQSRLGERRGERRLSVKEAFAVEFTKGTFLKRKGSGQGEDLSPSGIRFSSTVAPRKGEKLKLTVYLAPEFPGEKSLNVHAEVVRCKKKPGDDHYEIGCRLQAPDFPTRETLRQFMWWTELKRSDGSGKIRRS